MSKEQTQEINRLKQKNYRLESCSEVKHLHKLEKTIIGLNLKLKAKDRHIGALNKKISDLKTEIFQLGGKK